MEDHANGGNDFTIVAGTSARFRCRCGRNRFREHRIHAGEDPRQCGNDQADERERRKDDQHSSDRQPDAVSVNNVLPRVFLRQETAQCAGPFPADSSLIRLEEAAQEKPVCHRRCPQMAQPNERTAQQKASACRNCATHRQPTHRLVESASSPGKAAAPIPASVQSQLRETDPSALS